MLGLLMNGIGWCGWIIFIVCFCVVSLVVRLCMVSVMLLIFGG